MKLAVPRRVYRAEVASHIPGRLRVRFHRKARQPGVMNRVKTGLEKRRGIRGVDVNHAAGSMTLHYDPKVHSRAGILDVLEDLDVIAGSVVGIPEAEVDTRRHSTTAVTLADALDDLDRRVARVTGQTLDLRVLFPLSFAGIAAWAIWKRGLMLETLPGWLLLWVAFDLFVRLHPSLAPSARTPAAP